MDLPKKIKFTQTGNIFEKAILLALGLLIFVAILIRCDISAAESLVYLKRITLPYYLLFIFVMGSSFLAVTFRWKHTIDFIDPGNRFQRGFLFKYTMLSQLAGLYLLNLAGSAGVKILSLKIFSKIPLNKILAIIFIEQVLNILVIFSVSIPSLLYLSNLLSIELAFSIFLALNFFIIVVGGEYFSPILNKLMGWVRLFGQYWRKSPADEGKNLLQAQDNVAPNAKRISYKIVAYSAYAYFIPIVVNYFLASAINIKISFFEMLITLTLVHLAGVVNFIPGGLGIKEASWIVVFSILGLPKEQAAYFAICHRIITDSITIMFCLLGYLFSMLLNMAEKNAFSREN